jgi:diguanylate cyclase (GGDEF)-like protein
MLTGVLNRNEMNNRIDRITVGEDSIKNLGVVFADVNGLKRVNDEHGHISGDRLLKNAAEILQNVFSSDEVYRAGGDEFMIIAPDTSGEVLREKTDRLHQSDLGFAKTGFAVGWCFIEDSKDILNALHISDERMYEDKECFYRLNPELKR